MADDQTGTGALALVRLVDNTISKGGVLTIGLRAAGEPLLLILDLVEFIRRYLQSTSFGTVPIVIISALAPRLLAYADTCAEWLCEEKFNRVCGGHQPPLLPFAHAAMRRARLRRADEQPLAGQAGGGRPSLILARDLVELGNCSDYREPCVILAAEEVLVPLLCGFLGAGASGYDDNATGHHLVLCDSIGRSQALAQLNDWHDTAHAALNQRLAPVDLPGTAAFQATAPTTQRAQRAQVHHCPIDTRMSKAQCVACAAALVPDLPSLPNKSPAESLATWMSESYPESNNGARTEEKQSCRVEVVVPRHLAPMRRKRRRGAVAIAASVAHGPEELLSLRSQKPTAALHAELWCAVPGSVVELVGSEVLMR